MAGMTLQGPLRRRMMVEEKEEARREKLVVLVNRSGRRARGQSLLRLDNQPRARLARARTRLPYGTSRIPAQRLL